MPSMTTGSFSLIFFLLSHMSMTFAANDSPSRERISFNADWRFHKGDPPNAGEQLAYENIKDQLLRIARESMSGFSDPQRDAAPAFGAQVPFVAPGFADGEWRALTLPHDWGIEGPFKQEYPGPTGKLPWWGVGWYRKSFELPASDAGRRIYLDVDGAMSFATVWCNGNFVGGWPYGYSSWRVNLTPFVKPGQKNVVAIRLDNPPDSSRWYPGGGIYRNVWLAKTGPVHVAHWGTKIQTPKVTSENATVEIETRIDNRTDAKVDFDVQTQIFHLSTRDGVETRDLAANSNPSTVSAPAAGSNTVTQEISVDNPNLWSVKTPNLYVAVTRLIRDGKVVDEYETPFGIRKLEFTPDRGFLLNGERVQLQGVCNHHDLGALGAAFNLRAAERQLEIMKEMGANALRITHNPGAPELLDLCDRMGILVIAETFDCWHWGKTPNDYARLFNDWSELDLRAMIRRDRNHPSVIMWSIGNEIVKVEAPENADIAKRLIAIVHDEDITRAATAGVNNTPVAYSGYQDIYDVFGFNYRGMEYQRFHEKNPTIPVYGSETASTVSSRGEYFFPVTEEKGGGMSDFQMSSYDLYAPPWAWPPDKEFEWLDKAPATLGEFVWTGIDYLGEPTPYNDDWTNALNIADPKEREKLEKELEAVGKLEPPSRSSYFGIVDLAGFKKDRFYIYQARWRPELRMAHILPHWTWPEREGEITPVHVYTSGDEAELFLNDKSLGRKKRGPSDYRLRWDDVKYEPGELRVVAYKNGEQWAHNVVKTAGAASRIDAEADRTKIVADGKDLSFITVRITDATGVFAPRADNLVEFEISGPGDIIATDNGDATSHEFFQSQARKAFNGMALAIVRAKPGEAGEITVRAVAEGLEAAEVKLRSFTDRVQTNPAVVIDPSKSQGIWDGWGTSLCWFGKVFGDRDDVANALFTLGEVKLEDQTLPGLGMNIVRYNAGACSYNDVDGKKIVLSPNILKWRQIEGYWLDGKSKDPQSASWGWSVDANQRALMLMARDRGADRFELFSNSPMWWMCANHNPSGAASATDDNLPPENYEKFAVYLATIAKYAKENWGITFTTVEPFNEPNSNFWSANGRQEGCHFSSSAQAAVLKLLRKEMDERGLREMSIAASDESRYSWAIETWNSFDDATRALVNQVNVHGYEGLGGRPDILSHARQDKRLWNSEFGDGDADGLFMARCIHRDFAELRPTAWCYWQPLDGGNDGGWGLISANLDNATIGNANPKYFVFAQYSRHVRPDMTILTTEDKETVAAYDPKARKLVIVALNPSDAEQGKTFDLSKFDSVKGTAARWITETKGSTRLQRMNPASIEENQLKVNLPPASVQTIEVDGITPAKP
jgi:beta-galactosidase